MRIDVRRATRLPYEALVALFLNRVNLTFPVVLNRRWMKVPTIGRIGYSNIVAHEPWMVALLRRLLPLRDGAFIDIGTHLGETLLKVKSVDPETRYVGFEPNPVCVHYVRRLITNNRLKNCDVVSIGMSDVGGLASLGCYHMDYDGSATTVAGFRTTEIRHRFWVPVGRLDDVCDNLNLTSVSIMKIDVEGGELEVLKGAGRLLREVRPLVLCEILPVYSTENAFRKTRQEEIESLLKLAGYSIWRIEKGKKGHLAGVRPIESFGIHSDLSLCDYLFMPNEVSESVSQQVNAV